MAGQPDKKQLSKRQFLFGAIAGGCALQSARLISSTAFGSARLLDDKPHRTSFSQSGEDLIVAFIFDHLKQPQPSYLDIGTWDPVFDNNTYLFHTRGARGVLVEPNIDLIPTIERERPGDTILNVGIGIDSTAEVDYYRLTRSGWNTFSKEQAENCVRQTNGEVAITGVVKMPLLNINDVMARHFAGAAPDFLSIDVEGLDLPILKTLQFEKHRPKAICVETLVAGATQENPEIAPFLLSKGYVVRGSSFVNSIFLDRTFLDRHA